MNLMEKTIRKYIVIFTFPTLIAFFVAFVIPFLMGLYLSFCKFTTVTNAKFIGLENYVKALTSEDFHNALFFTVKFALVAVLSINVLAFVLAVLLTKKIKGTNLFRTVFFMPNLIGGIILGYIWQSMINAILVQYQTTLIANATYGFWGLVILMNWQMIGYMMIIYIAGLQNVPLDLIEAAKIDGATSMQTLFKIKIPMIMTSITICLFLTVSNCFKLFDQNLALTAGAPSKKTAMLALDIYNSFYGRSGFEGVGQAKAVIFFCLVALITILQLQITRKREVEQ
jgi:raffinose/stachyose/melibiose transport system permease protein